MDNVIDRVGLYVGDYLLLFKITYSENGDLISVRDGYNNELIYGK